MKLKIAATGKSFGNICLRAIRDIFCNMRSAIKERDGVRHEGKGEDSTFWWGSYPTED